MHVEDLKRWHWIVIGLLVGLVFGYVQSEFGADGYRAEGGTMSQSTFERNLMRMRNGANEQGHPIFDNIVVRKVDGGYAVTMEELKPPKPGERPPTHWKYTPYELTRLGAAEPYEPLFDRGGGNTTDIKIRPDS